MNLKIKAGRYRFVPLAESVCTAYPCCWDRAGPPAAAIRQLRQARKGAAATVMPGAGVRLARYLFYKKI
jgi:hypothetical protein